MKERIKGAFTKKKIFHFLKMALFVVALSLILLSLLGTVAHATGLVDDTINAENLYSKYPLSNYQLDFYVDNSWSWLPWNWLDGIGKSVQYGLYCITNFVWTISLYLSNATGYVVQEAYKLDFINDMADSIGKGIQTLAGVTQNGFSSSGFYVGFLLLIILVVGMYVAYTGLIKRETSKALHAVINFVVVFVLSASFIAYAPDYIKKINEFSSDISTASLDLGTKIMLPNSDSEGRRMEHRIARVVSAGGISGGVAGAVAGSAVAGKRAERKNTASKENRGNTTSSMGQRAGSKVGAVLDTKNKVKDKANAVKENIKDMPTQTAYAVYSAKEKAKSSVSDFKRGMVQEEQSRQSGRLEKQEQRKKNIADKRMELQKAQEARQAQRKADGSATTGATRPHERPATASTIPKSSAEKMQEVKRPATAPTPKASEPVKTNVVKERPLCGNDIRICDDELAEALKHLSERNRENLLMYYFLEMSDTEIAKRQNISRSGVFQNRHNSLELMKKILKEK